MNIATCDRISNPEQLVAAVWIGDVILRFAGNQGININNSQIG